ADLAADDSRLEAEMRRLEQDVPPPSASATLQGLDAAAGETPAGPAQVHEYRLLKKLGQGGMGVVYQALHLRLEKLVALKLICAGRAGDAQVAERFRREMRAIGKLNHPNIVQATDAGEVGGTLYLAMEFLE